MGHTSSMERTRWGARVVAVMAASVLLAGCGDVDKGSAKGADFERGLTARVGDSIEEVVIGPHNSLPWIGTFDATVTVNPVASADDLEQVMTAVADLLAASGSSADSGDSGDSARVWANGVEICAEGARRAPHLALREGLRAASRSLAGTLDCDTYAGELADVSADIAAVQAVIAKDDAVAGLRIDGRISSPRGEIEGLWRDLTPNLSEALGAVGRGDLNRFDLDGTVLNLSLQPGVDEARLRADVKRVAPDVALRVVAGGSQGGEGTSVGPEAARLRAELGALPGVIAVRFTSESAVVVRVTGAADVAPVVSRARELTAAVGEFHLHVTTQESDYPTWTVDEGTDFELPGNAEVAHLDDFAALASAEGISAVGWREPMSGRTRQVTITAPTGGDLRDVLPAIKAHVPVGSDLNLHLGNQDYYFDVAASLTAADGQGRELPRAFVETWNSLP